MEEPGASKTGQAAQKRPAGNVGQFLHENFPRLPKHDQWLFNHSSKLMSINAAACGLMANSLFRRALKVRKYFLLSCLPAAVVPGLFTAVYYDALISLPLLSGTLNCPVCAVTRSAYVGVFMGGLAPVAMAGFISLKMVPEELRTAPKENLLRAIVNFTKPVLVRLKYFLLFEAVTSVFLASRQLSALEKIYQMAQVPETGEVALTE